ncbi:MAG: DUF4062 domain-containing protein [Bacteroidales bacterium]|nr:DUF4062 domain-containing protein [Bacteroidales bacterium]
MKKTVFISSTYIDLQEERKELWKALEKFNVIVKGMEKFGARTEDALTTCLNEVEQSDIYIGIIGVRFGSIDKATKKSYTQLEYEKAVESKQLILIYLIDTENAHVIPSHFDIHNQEKLKIFKSKLKENHTVDFFKDSTDLVDKLNRQFKKYLKRKEEEKKSTDDYENSINVLNRFFLTPKSVTGREIRLRINFEGNPYPLSKEICSKFGLSYGNTIGSEIKVIKPKLNPYLNNLSSICIDSKNVDTFLELDKAKEYDVLARIMFHEETINKKSTMFMDFKYEVMIDPPDDYMQGVDIPDPYATYTEIRKGEGCVTLVLKEITSTANTQ